MRRGEWLAGRPLRVREPFEERLFRFALFESRVRSGNVSLADDVTAAPARLPSPLLPAHFRSL